MAANECDQIVHIRTYVYSNTFTKPISKINLAQLEEIPLLVSNVQYVGTYVCMFIMHICILLV